PETLSNLLPSGRPPVESIGRPSSFVRQRPIASKFSSEKPIGSMRLWQLAQAALARCSARRCLTDNVAETVFSFNAGTFGNGGGGGAPIKFSSTHLPRITGEVRVAYEVTVSTLPCRSKPPRSLSLPSATRRKRLPYTFGMP